MKEDKNKVLFVYYVEKSKEFKDIDEKLEKEYLSLAKETLKKINKNEGKDKSVKK